MQWIKKKKKPDRVVTAPAPILFETATFIASTIQTTITTGRLKHGRDSVAESLLHRRQHHNLADIASLYRSHHLQVLSFLGRTGILGSR